MSKVSEKMGPILNMGMRPGRWMEYYNLLYKDGRPDSKEFKQMIFALCEIVEELEMRLESKPAEIYVQEEVEEEPIIDEPLRHKSKRSKRA